MSHLLHNPYNKPSPFDLPRAVQPLTPPDTDSEFVGQPFRSAPVNGTDALDSDPLAPQASAVETSTPFFRRQPSVAYIHSGPRDFRERSLQRSSIKWLVVVVPPASFSREHGHLGHTLSSGSPNRLSQGILMPLFPTVSIESATIYININSHRFTDEQPTRRNCPRVQLPQHGRPVSIPAHKSQWHILVPTHH